MSPRHLTRALRRVGHNWAGRNLHTAVQFHGLPLDRQCSDGKVVTIRVAQGDEAPAGHLVAEYLGEVICAEEWGPRG